MKTKNMPDLVDNVNNVEESIKEDTRVGATIGKVALNLLQGLANWVGLGDDVKNLTKDATKIASNFDVDKFKNTVRKIVTYAMQKENLNVEALQNKLDNLGMYMPNANLRGFVNDQKAKLKDLIIQGKDKAAKLEANLASVEGKLNEFENLSAGQVAFEGKKRASDIKTSLNAALKDSSQSSFDFDSYEQKL